MKNEKYIYIGIACVALIIGLFHSLSLSYVNDDCFISFRYAKNLVDGLGLVYNAGERVEGFTNFLWTIIIALGLKLNFDPVIFSIDLGIIFYLFTLILYTILSWKFRAFGKSQLFIIPLTTLALALHRDFSAHATSGMETSMFSFFISACFVILILWQNSKSYLSAGFLLVLAMMTRPDGIIFLFAGIIFIVLTLRKPFKNLFLFLLPSAIIFLPYWIWRYKYYGFFYPNSFYAKSIDQPYYSQGIEYAFLYFKTYYVFVLIIILGSVLIWKTWKIFSANKKLVSIWNIVRAESNQSHPLLLAGLFIAGYTFFTIRIGGDFMFARFFIAITPMMFFVIELLIKKLFQNKISLVVMPLVLAAVFFRADQYGNEKFVGYIADESRYFTSDYLKASNEDGMQLKKCFSGLPVRIAFDAGLLQLIYYADPPYALEASAGLTDTGIAHQLLLERGRPGHEKQPTLDYLIEKKIHFFLGYFNPIPEGSIVLNAIQFNRIIGRIIVYDNEIMTKLALNPEVKFIQLPEYLDKYISEMKNYPTEKIEQDYLFLKPFYFDHNNDNVREAAFISILQNKKPPGIINP